MMPESFCFPTLLSTMKNLSAVVLLEYDGVVWSGVFGVCCEGGVVKRVMV